MNGALGLLMAFSIRLDRPSLPRKRRVTQHNRVCCPPPPFCGFIRVARVPELRFKEERVIEGEPAPRHRV